MKEATLYSVTSKRILVAKDYHEVYSLNEPFGTRDMEIAAFMSPDPQMQVEVQRWPVHNIRRGENGRLVLDEYIVIDPKCARFLRFLSKTSIKNCWPSSMSLRVSPLSE